ncbi:MAG: hypothetical protein E6Z87_03935 [Finegoldia magna]|uniref:hypothetical protein n=1 Tax=Finegoldia magna TaxID=1260 RepID=UPI001F4F688C|nr:hypothetical protein [Finegoldia magna]MDU5743169.1 hypothetical protein [Finegoldia magna]
MKIPMDGRNHGAGLNSSSPCATAGGRCSINKGGCVSNNSCGSNSCGNVYVPMSFCWTVKVFGDNPKIVQRFKKFVKNLVVVMIIIMTTTGFTYSNNVQKVPDYIEEDILKGNIKLEDKTHVNLKSKISQEEYEKTIKDVENYLKENHVIFNNTSREEFSAECEKFIRVKKEHTIVDTILDLKVLGSSLKQGHLGFGTGYFTEKLPVDLILLKDGYYIKKCDKQDSNMLESKLLAINNTPIEGVEEKVSKYFLGENKNISRVFSTENIRIVDNLRRENIVNGNEITLKLEKNGKIFYKSVIPQNFRKWEFGKLNTKNTDFYFMNKAKILDRINNQNSVSIKPIDVINQTEKNFYSEIKNKDLIIYYNSCLDNAEFNIFDFSKEINKKLYESKPSTIVIDLRFNRGGSTDIYPYILKEMSLYQIKNPKTKIKVLISNNSYSATAYATIQTMRIMDNIEVIGSDSGFTIKNTTGSDSKLYVKSLKLYCNYGSEIYKQNYEKEDVFKHNYKNYDYKNDMLTPDFHAEQSFADYMIGNDPAMNYALRDEGDSSLINKIKQIFK